MNIREFSRPVQAEKLNESLAKQFGQRINLDEFTLEQLHTARNKLRTSLSQVETNESFSSVQKPAYQKSKLFLDVLNAEINERELVQDANLEESVISEGEEDKAELVMASKDMVDRVTGWMEDTAEMQTESMLDLADAIRDEMGSEQSEAFVNTVKPALEQMYDVMETTRAALTTGVGMLTGEGEAMDTMGMDDMGDMDMEPTDDMDTVDAGDEVDMDGEDDFATDASAAGGEEEAGRAKRESATPKGKRIKEGKVKDAMIGDSEKMTKAEFAKKHGKEAADDMYESKKK
jgi:hypothetical protein